MRREGAGGGEPGAGGVGGVYASVPSCSSSASPNLDKKLLPAFFPYGLAAGAAAAAGAVAAGAVVGAGEVLAGGDVAGSACAAAPMPTSPRAARPRAQRLDFKLLVFVPIGWVIITRGCWCFTFGLLFLNVRTRKGILKFRSRPRD